SYVPVSRSQEHVVADRARSLDQQDRRRPDFLLPPARHLHRRRRQHDRARVLQGSLPRTADGVRRGSSKTLGSQSRRKRRLSIRTWHYSKSKICTPAWAIVKFSRASTSPSIPVKCTPSWAPTGPAKARSPEFWPAANSMRSPKAR